MDTAFSSEHQKKLLPTSLMLQKASSLTELFSQQRSLNQQFESIDSISWPFLLVHLIYRGIYVVSITWFIEDCTLYDDDFRLHILNSDKIPIFVNVNAEELL